MNVNKEDFLLLIALMKSQYQKDIASGEEDNENIWAASLKLLSMVLGEENAKTVERWIFDSEGGRFPSEDLPARSEDELWEFLKR